HIHWEKKNGNWIPFEVMYFDESDKEKRIKDRTIFYDLASTTDATNEQKMLFGKRTFDNSKPVELIRRLVDLTTTGVDGCIVLDFFAGSGTTAEAVMRLNAEDSGNRSFILAQWDEVIDKKASPQAHQFCAENDLPPVISSITIERANRAGKNINEENGALLDPLDIGYKVFSVVDRPTLEETDDGQLQLKLNWPTAKDILYNMMAMSGEVLLTNIIEEVEISLLYKVDNSYFVLGECKTSLDQYASYRIYINGYADIRLERWLNLFGLDRENVKILY
ncbi:MAG: DNA methyltransferase, partial [Salinispira sp.]